MRVCHESGNTEILLGDSEDYSQVRRTPVTMSQMHTCCTLYYAPEFRSQRATRFPKVEYFAPAAVVCRRSKAPKYNLKL